MHIDSQEAVERARKNGWPVKEEGNHSVLEAPGGYKFIISHKPQPSGKGENLLISFISIGSVFLQLFFLQFFVDLSMSTVKEKLS